MLTKENILITVEEERLMEKAIGVLIMTMLIMLQFLLTVHHLTLTI